jgi:hypothetical protein
VLSGISGDPIERRRTSMRRIKFSIAAKLGLVPAKLAGKYEWYA